MKPSTFLLVPFAALATAQGYQYQPRAVDGALVHGNILPQRAAGHGAPVVVRAKGSKASGTAGGTATAKATGKAGATGKASATGSGAKATGTASSKATATAATTSASATATTVTTSGASAGREVDGLRSGVFAFAGAALGFAWLM